MGVLDVSPEDITDGPIARTLVVLSLPLVVQNLVQVLNQLIDTLWLGRVGEAEVAAVGLNFPILAVLFGVTATATVGTQILVAQRVGGDRPGAARRVVVNGLGLAVALGVVLVAVVTLVGDDLVRALAAGPRVATLAVAYLLIYAAFLPFGAAIGAIDRGFVGWGDTRAALYINGLTVLVNLLLDPLLILGFGPVPALGVRGAALATGIGYVFGFVAAIALATGRRPSMRLTRADVALAPSDLRQLIAVGAPISGQRIAGQSARVAIIGVVAAVGGAAGLAAYTVGARVATIAFVPATGFGSAAQSMIGQNLGATRTDRAHATVRTAIAIAAGGLAIVGLGQWLLARGITAVIAPALTPEGFALSVTYLEILAYGYPAMGASAVLLAAFNGAARTRISLAVDLLKYWGLRIPAAVAALPAAAVAVDGLVFGGLGLGVLAVFWAVTGSNVLVAVGVAGYYLRRYEGMYRRAAERSAGTRDERATG